MVVIARARRPWLIYLHLHHFLRQFASMLSQSCANLFQSDLLELVAHANEGQSVCHSVFLSEHGGWHGRHPRNEISCVHSIPGVLHLLDFSSPAVDPWSVSPAQFSEAGFDITLAEAAKRSNATAVST